MKNPLITKVHFLISILFIASFGLFAVSIMLHAAHMEDPITGSLESMLAE